MAGIGFSLRAAGLGGGYFAQARSFGSAALISSGPWALASIGMLVLGRGAAAHDSERFRVSVTWILAGSLVWTSPLQLTFTRFVADREYAREREAILPNVLGAIAFASVASAAVVICTFASGAFRFETRLVRVLLGVAFVATCDAWLVSLVLSSLREHRAVLGCFCAGYLVAGIGCWLSTQRGLVSLVASFAAGQATLLFSGVAILARCLPRTADRAHRGTASRECAQSSGECELLAFRFLGPSAMMLELALGALAFNLGCWADELVFWLDPVTSHSVIGPLRASTVYDLPSFAASVCVLPGVAVFIVHVETEFAQRQRAFFDAVRGGATLSQLDRLAQLLTDAARSGGASLLRTQTLAWLAFVACAPSVLDSSLHVPLASVTAFALALQMLVSALLGCLYYLDRRRDALAVSLLVCFLNFGLSWGSQHLGPMYFGFGHALAMGLSCLAGLWLFNRALANLVRNTFMLQPAGAA